MMFEEDIQLDPQICRQCRGLCCQGHAGCWVDPVRFFGLFFAGRQLGLEELRPLLPSRHFVLRDYSGVPVPAPWTRENGCHFLGEKGCRLELRLRPCQCLALVPSVDTLMDGEIRCQLPGAFSFGAVREVWQRYWFDLGDLS